MQRELLLENGNAISALASTWGSMGIVDTRHLDIFRAAMLNACAPGYIICSRVSVGRQNLEIP